MSQFSEAVANARNDAIETVVGSSAKIMVYSGSPPADCSIAATGTLLAQYDLAADWMAASTAGVCTLNNLPLNTTALADGTPGYARLYANDGVTCGWQGTVGVSGSGSDWTISNATVVTDEAVNIISGGFTDGNYP